MQQDVALLKLGKIVAGTLWVATGSTVPLSGGVHYATLKREEAIQQGG